MDERIVLFIRSLSVGGAEGVCVSIANELKRSGRNVEVLTLVDLDSYRINSLDPKISMSSLGIKHARSAFNKLFKWLTKNPEPKTFLVFNHQLTFWLVLLRFLFRFKFRIVSRNINTLSLMREHEKSWWHRHVSHFLVAQTLRFSDAIIAQSSGSRDDLVANYKVKSDMIFCIPNPVSPQFRNVNTSIIHSDDPYILCVGRLEKQKSFDIAIEVFATIIADYPKLSLKIVGTGSDENYLKSLVYKLGLEKKVFFLGSQLRMNEFYQNARLTLLTSLFEGFPNVLVESISCGTPVVAYDCPSGPRDIIVDKENGILVHYLDRLHLKQSIIEALNFEWSKDKIISSSQRFECSKIVAEYLKVLCP